MYSMVNSLVWITNRINTLPAKVVRLEIIAHLQANRTLSDYHLVTVAATRTYTLLGYP